jgi:hypothetical protein
MILLQMCLLHVEAFSRNLFCDNTKLFVSISTYQELGNFFLHFQDQRVATLFNINKVKAVPLQA